MSKTTYTTKKHAANGWQVIIAEKSTQDSDGVSSFTSKWVATIAKFPSGFTVWPGTKPSKVEPLGKDMTKAQADGAIAGFVETL